MSFWIGCAALAVAGPGQALTLPSNMTKQISVQVTGQVTPRCTLTTSQNGGTSFGDITDAHTGRATAAILELPFTMSCNSPYVATLTSKNGALAYEGGATPNFASSVDYSARLALNGEAGGLKLDCDSQRMKAASATDALQAACRAASAEGSKGDGRVRLQLRPGAEPLLRGVYSDELVLRISPTVSG